MRIGIEPNTKFGWTERKKSARKKNQLNYKHWHNKTIKNAKEKRNRTEENEILSGSMVTASLIQNSYMYKSKDYP